MNPLYIPLEVSIVGKMKAAAKGATFCVWD
jgi:hypothetical protein